MRKIELEWWTPECYAGQCSRAEYAYTGEDIVIRRWTDDSDGETTYSIAGVRYNDEGEEVTNQWEEPEGWDWRPMTWAELYKLGLLEDVLSGKHITDIEDFDPSEFTIGWPVVRLDGTVMGFWETGKGDGYPPGAAFVRWGRLVDEDGETHEGLVACNQCIGCVLLDPPKWLLKESDELNP
jgi:hypothetical protein